MPDFLPRRESDLLAWSALFEQLLTASPQKYAISPQQAANYRTLQLAFAAAYPLVATMPTRTVVTVANKDAARGRCWLMCGS